LESPPPIPGAGGVVAPLLARAASRTGAAEAPVKSNFWSWISPALLPSSWNIEET